MRQLFCRRIKLCPKDHWCQFRRKYDNFQPQYSSFTFQFTGEISASALHLEFNSCTVQAKPICVVTLFLCSGQDYWVQFFAAGRIQSIVGPKIFPSRGALRPALFCAIFYRQQVNITLARARVGGIIGSPPRFKTSSV